MIVSGTGYVTGPRADAGQRLEAHLKYIQYRAGGEGEGPRIVFGETEDALALREAHEMILDQGRDGLRFHKIVISPAESERVGDWTAFTRQVMDDLGRRVGLQLTWCATVHQSTDHPHVHIVLAGDGERADGRAMQVRLYTPHYEFLRERAEWHTEQAWEGVFAAVLGQEVTRAPQHEAYLSPEKPAGDAVQSRGELFDHLRASAHTETSGAILRRIEAGEVRVDFDPTIEAYGTTSVPGRIVVNPNGSIDTVLSTLVHEGQHERDLTNRVIPLPQDATLSDRAWAEGRAFHYEAEFATANDLRNSQAFKLAKVASREFMITIITSPSYAKTSQLSDMSDDDVKMVIEKMVELRGF